MMLSKLLHFVYKLQIKEMILMREAYIEICEKDQKKFFSYLFPVFDMSWMLPESLGP